MAWQDIADAIIDDLKLAVGYLPRVNDLRDSEGRMIDSKQVPSRERRLQSWLKCMHGRRL